jgi:hypothetical protein
MKPDYSDILDAFFAALIEKGYTLTAQKNQVYVNGQRVKFHFPKTLSIEEGKPPSYRTSLTNTDYLHAFIFPNGRFLCVPPYTPTSTGKRQVRIPARDIYLPDMY